MSVVYLLIGSLCVFALAYRYYAAFIATKVLMLDDRNIAPSVLCNDGQNYVPTNKWVVFGHHFACSSIFLNSSKRNPQLMPANRNIFQIRVNWRYLIR